MTSDILRDRGRFDTHRRGGGTVTADAEAGVVWSQIKKDWQRQKLEETRNGFSSVASGGSTALLTS